MQRFQLLGFALLIASCGNSSTGVYTPPRGNPPAGGNVGFGGGQDFGAFRQALDDGKVPGPDSIDPTGFFAEHYTTLPDPDCGDRLCLHAMLSVSPDLVHGGRNQTLLQIGVNTPLDPERFPRPPLDLVVVVDRSGSMAAEDKISFARAGVKKLIDELGETDSLTLISFDDVVQVEFGPARVANRAQVKAIVDRLAPRNGTNIHDALEQAYQMVVTGVETNQRRVIFLTDGLPTAGVTDPEQIRRMSAGYNERHVQLTTIAVGHDAGLSLMRSLAEQGGGNFYFLEDPQAVTEVFAKELRFFVAPIAYDLELRFDAGEAYRVASLEGSSLWQKSEDGGAIHRPSVYLASRTSDDPDETGGRRGGGAALLARLDLSGVVAERGHRVARATMRYRLPGELEVRSQEVVVTYADRPGQCGSDGYFSHAPIGKNALILAFYTAFHEATVLARTDLRAARRLLEKFQERIEGKLARPAAGDADLQDDLVILARLIAVLSGS